MGTAFWELRFRPGRAAEEVRQANRVWPRAHELRRGGQPAPQRGSARDGPRVPAPREGDLRNLQTAELTAEQLDEHTVVTNADRSTNGELSKL